MNDFFEKLAKTLWHHIKNKPYKYIFLLIAVALIIPVIIWLLYLVGDIWIGIPTHITAGNALGFYGSLLAFLGTVALGALALWQNIQFRNANKEDSQNKRIEEVRPIFLIRLYSVYDEETHNSNISLGDEVSKKGTFQLYITHLGKYPIFNFGVNNSYVSDCVMSNESKIISGYFSDCPSEPHKASVLFEEQEPTDKSGCPCFVTIHYDDYDGNSSFQIFKKKTYENAIYYTLDDFEIT